MRSNSAEREKPGNEGIIDHHHAIQICEVNKDKEVLTSMQQKLSQPPRLLKSSAGSRSCCIFRVPQSLIDINGKAYQPLIVSIGPYHHGKSHLRMIEEHKWRYLGSLLSRTNSKGLGLENYLRAVKPLEQRARECYSETVSLDRDEFVEMMVLDGVFIIELFRIVGKSVQPSPNDPLFAMSWVFPFLLRDLLRLENQLPFFVLQTLFDLSKMPEPEEPADSSLVTLALLFFDNAFEFLDSAGPGRDEVIKKFNQIQGKHLLDLFRSSFIPATTQEKPRRGPSKTQVIQCVTRLRRAGIRFKSSEADSFLDLKFTNGVLTMPKITVDDFMSSFIVNCIAYEQCCKHCSKHITTYATLMDCLINTTKDVGYLCDYNVIENYFGTDAELACFFNDLGKDVSFDIQNCYLTQLFDDVNSYYYNNWHVRWASFKYTYFDTPWSFISAVAAVVLLLLTTAQTFYTVYPYFRPPKE
ncbi:PREDICTED: UPF0481 protein At3g47200-like [Nelumbo nucifera]|uniref:Uncharacterized protein n=2 Tax=Nelumbo nucifera TaxID=4432 RepID=A0A822YBS1_NELNU|nr:PREDICTED: UPF0481 protein At3g47200-like [Nelumbo nucifera]DAD28749.1 TPA_asm: hypothetical protein HUJ06_030217 [Nelumbo nucifera]